MKAYGNMNGNSSVVAYEIGQSCIDVQFSNGKVYRYSYASAGKENVEQMKILADLGYGLNQFIIRYVRDKYVR